MATPAPNPFPSSLSSAQNAEATQRPNTGGGNDSNFGDGSKTTGSQGANPTGQSPPDDNSPKPKQKAITFNAPDLSLDRVFTVVTTPTKDFQYSSLDADVELLYLHWLGKTNESTDYESIANHSFASTHDGTPSTNKFLDKPSFESTTLNFNALALDVNAEKFLGQIMQVRIDWENKGSQTEGRSFSGIFGVINDGTKTPRGVLDQEMTRQIEANPDLVSGYDEVDSTAATSTSAQASPTSVSADKGSSKGGLSTGAKAGIAVGVVLGALLIIGALALFLIRRRRQNKDSKGLGGQQSSGTYMVDKETHGRTTDSPNSPYSDENQTRHVNLEDLDTSRKGPNVHAEQPSFTPYDDAPGRPSMSGSHGGLGNNTGSQTPTQPMASNVAHLVEDGMTREEIERLEEEERQLDAEIERAARR